MSDFKPLSPAAFNHITNTLHAELDLTVQHGDIGNITWQTRNAKLAIPRNPRQQHGRESNMPQQQQGIGDIDARKLWSGTAMPPINAPKPCKAAALPI